MAEQLVEAIEREPLMNTPFLRRVRKEGQVEGRAEGMIESILDVLITRLNLSVPTYRRLEHQLTPITDLDRLRELLQTAIRADDIADFEKALGDLDNGRAAE